MVEEAVVACGRFASKASQSLTDFGKLAALSSALVTSARKSFSFLVSSFSCCEEAPGELERCQLYAARATSAAMSRETPAMIVLFLNVKSRPINSSRKPAKVRTRPDPRPVAHSSDLNAALPVKRILKFQARE